MPTSEARGQRHRAAANLKGLNDPILAPLFDAADDEERRAAIGEILERVQPLVTTIVRRFRRSEPALRPEDAEELVAVVLLRVLRKLQLTALLESERIEKLEGYVATLTKNVLHDFRRRRFPERTRLKNKLRYILTHDPRFAVRLEDDEMLCALADAPALPGVAPLPTLANATPRMREERRPADAVAAVLAHAGRPVALSALLDTLIEIWNIHETPALSEPLQQVAPADQLSTLESKESLQALWREIQDLPRNQRAALLLNLRDGHGGNALTLFLLLNVAGVEEIAAAVGLPAAELSEVWPRLPLDDLTIAERLGLKRQQVINLRNSARARLVRRTRGKN